MARSLPAVAGALLLLCAAVHGERSGSGPRGHPLAPVAQAVTREAALCQAQATDRCAREDSDREICVTCLYDACMERETAIRRCARPPLVETKVVKAPKLEGPSAEELLAQASDGIMFLRAKAREREEQKRDEVTHSHSEKPKWAWQVDRANPWFAVSSPALELRYLRHIAPEHARSVYEDLPADE